MIAPVSPETSRGSEVRDQRCRRSGETGIGTPKASIVVATLQKAPAEQRKLVSGL